MKLAFYRFCLWFAEYALAIANSTGRNSISRNQLCQDVQFWSRLVRLEEVQQPRSN